MQSLAGSARRRPRSHLEVPRRSRAGCRLRETDCRSRGRAAPTAPRPADPRVARDPTLYPNEPKTGPWLRSLLRCVARIVKGRAQLTSIVSRPQVKDPTTPGEICLSAQIVRVETDLTQRTCADGHCRPRGARRALLVNADPTSEPAPRRPDSMPA